MASDTLLSGIVRVCLKYGLVGEVQWKSLPELKRASEFGRTKVGESGLNNSQPG